MEDIVSLERVSNGMTISGSKQTLPCQTCTVNKQTRQPHSQDIKPSLATQPLERVHSDPSGPITPTSREGHNYVMNLIDEFSSMVFVYNIRHKDDAIVALKQFIADVSPIGNVKELHTDNGGEYTSQSFQNILRQPHQTFYHRTLFFLPKWKVRKDVEKPNV